MTNVFYILIEGGEVVLFLYLKGGKKRRHLSLEEVVKKSDFKKTINW